MVKGTNVYDFYAPEVAEENARVLRENEKDGKKYLVVHNATVDGFSIIVVLYGGEEHEYEDK